MSQYFFEDPVEFFKDISTNSPMASRYANDFLTFLKFIEVKNPQHKLENFSAGKIDEPTWESIKKKHEEKSTRLVLPQFANSLTDLIETSSLL